MDNPYVLETIPTTLTFEGAFDVYYTYTFSEDCTLVITYTDGTFVGVDGADWDKDEATHTYTVTVTAGSTVVFNPWSTTPGQTYTVTFDYAA